jgi:transcriptional regulator with XRE-family HTH domain
MNHNWIYPVIGEHIRRRRKLLKITQAKLAPRLGLSRASLANIETGRQRLLVDQLFALAEALNLAPADLLPTLDGAPTAPAHELPLPKDLSSKQKEQISRLLAKPQPISSAKGTKT